MVHSARSNIRKAQAAACLVLLAALSLTMTPNPPADPMLRALGELLRAAVSIPLQAAFLLGVFGGLAILATLVAMVVGQYLRGVRVDWWSYLARRLWQMALACSLATLASLLLHFLKPMHDTGVSPGRTFAQPSQSQGKARSAQIPMAPPISRAPVFLAVAAFLAGMGGLLFALRGKGRHALAAPLPEESERLAAARRRLALGDQVRDAIIDCYAEMCSVFSGPSTRGSQSLTAREFATLLRRRGIGEPEILTLTSVFEKARYSSEPCDEGDRSQAITALQVIESRYGAPEDRVPT